MGEFDEDTRVERVGEAVWRGTATSRWNIGDTPNGGYVMAIGMSALAEASSQPDPLNVTAHYIDRTAPGDVEIAVEVLRTSRNHWAGQARVGQDGALRVLLTASYTDLSAQQGSTAVSGRPRGIPPPDRCEAVPSEGPFIPECSRRYQFRLAPEVAGVARGEPSGVAEVGGWVRFADGREPDLRSLAAIVDAFPPPIQNLGLYGRIPTLTFSVQFRAAPSPGWLHAWFVTRFLVNGYLEEDGEIWDSSEKLVALSRQMARLQPPGAHGRQA